MRNALSPAALFDLSRSRAGDYLAALTYPHEALSQIDSWIAQIGACLPVERYEKKGDGLWIARNAVIAPSACITGPCIVGEGTEIRHNAFIRGNVLIGDGCVIGNATELKGSILFDGVQVPHYNYVGDSILGYRAHLGAAAIASNVRADKQNVIVHTPWGDVETGRRKLGAMVGDRAEIGCGAVLAPGCVVGRDAIVYPLTLVRGVLPAGHILRSDKSIIKRN